MEPLGVNHGHPQVMKRQKIIIIENQSGTHFKKPPLIRAFSPDQVSPRALSVWARATKKIILLYKPFLQQHSIHNMMCFVNWLGSRILLIGLYLNNKICLFIYLTLT